MSATPENVKPINGAPKVEAPTTEPPTERRGRGRPRKDGAANGTPRPEIKASEKPNKRKGKVSFDDAAKNALAQQVYALHQIAALTTGIPELNIHAVEANSLAGAIANVCEEYDLALDGKTGALIQLAAACAAIYVPRYFTLQARVKKAKDMQNSVIDVVTPVKVEPNADVTAH